MPPRPLGQGRAPIRLHIPFLPVSSTAVAVRNSQSRVTIAPRHRSAARGAFELAGAADPVRMRMPPGGSGMPLCAHKDDFYGRCAHELVVWMAAQRVWGEVRAHDGGGAARVGPGGIRQQRPARSSCVFCDFAHGPHGARGHHQLAGEPPAFCCRSQLLEVVCLYMYAYFLHWVPVQGCDRLAFAVVI